MNPDQKTPQVRLSPPGTASVRLIEGEGESMEPEILNWLFLGKSPLEFCRDISKMRS